MRSNWCRLGDLSSPEQSKVIIDGRGNSIPVREVHYLDMGKGATIPRISATFKEPSDRSWSNNLQIQYSPLCHDQLYKLARQYHLPLHRTYGSVHRYKDGGLYICLDIFMRDDSNPFDRENSFIVDGEKDDLNSLISFAKAVNLEFKEMIFTPELIEEIKMLFTLAIDHDFTKTRHLIAETNIPFLVSPETRQHYLLSDLFNDYSTARLKTALSGGEDPNKPNMHGETAIQQAIFAKAPLEAFRLLIWFNADPYLRTLSKMEKMFCSPIETASAYSRDDVCDAIGIARTNPTSLTPRFHNISVRVFRAHHRPVTQISINNKIVLQTYYLHMKDVSETQKEILFKHFSSTFEASDKSPHKTTRELFLDEFNDTRHIELIYSNGNLIGFILFETIILTNHPDTIILHIPLSYIEKAHQGHGLMTFLAFRQAYAMQQLFPEKKIGVFFSVVHYNSYQGVRFFKHFPKYKNNAITDIASDIISHIYKGQTNYHNDGLTTYIEELLRVKTNNGEAKPLSFDEEMFMNFFLGINDRQTMARHAYSVPVLFFVNGENRARLQNISNIMGFDFSESITQLANAQSATAMSATPSNRFMSRL